MNIRKYLIAATSLLLATACSGSKKNDNQNHDTPKEQTRQAKTTQPNHGKALVVFFSHAGDNYAVGKVKEGNTKIVADYISNITGADQFELKTTKYDGMEYSALTELAQQEANRNELPKFNGSIKDIGQYDTIFIGGPVWWGTYPRIMFTFFKQYDLNGKTIIPFTTHEGSGLGNCVDDVRSAYPKAKVVDGFSIYGHEVWSGKAKVAKWLKSIGY